MPSDPKMRALLIHLGAYVAVNAVLIVINLMQTPAEGEARELWFVWPLIGWGIGVAAHGLGILLEQRSAHVAWMKDEAKRGFAVHAFVFVAVNALLYVVDLVTGPGVQWAYWVTLGWGAGLAAHGYLAWRGGGSQPVAPATRAESLRTSSPWPRSSPTDSPKTGAAAAPASPQPARAAPVETPASTKPAPARKKPAARKAKSPPKKT